MKCLSILSVILSSTKSYGPPSLSDWQQLAESLGDKLVLKIQPPAAPCHTVSYNASECELVVAKWQNSTWRSSQMGAMQVVTWEQLNGSWCGITIDDRTGNPTNSTDPISSTCSQGNIPKFGVIASSPVDITTVVKFASKFSVPLVIKGTGHDWMGRSTHPERLLIWTHHMKNITYGALNTCGTTYQDTITVAAGVQWGEVYNALAGYGRVVPGAGNINVGASGGHIQGGGIGPLTNTYGPTPDSVIQFEVITLDGVQRTVNRCSHPDLFWALRGGGGGTFAIVTSTTYKTYPDTPTAFAYFAYNDTPAAFPMVIDNFARYSPKLAELGWLGYVNGVDGVTTAAFILPLTNNTTFQTATDSLIPFFKSLNESKGLVYLSSAVIQLPSMQSYYNQFLLPEKAGGTRIVGSRLIPKSVLQNAATRTNIANLSAAMRNDTLGINVVAVLYSGNSALRPVDNAVPSAHRKAIWHMLFTAPIPVDGTELEIDRAFKATTERIEPLRQATPGSGAYMNEGDPRAPAWKEDFFGENYERLLSIKMKWDPEGLLRCNRCVGSDL